MGMVLFVGSPVVMKFNNNVEINKFVEVNNFVEVSNVEEDPVPW